MSAGSNFKNKYSAKFKKISNNEIKKLNFVIKCFEESMKQKQPNFKTCTIINFKIALYSPGYDWKTRKLGLQNIYIVVKCFVPFWIFNFITPYIYKFRNHISNPQKKKTGTCRFICVFISARIWFKMELKTKIYYIFERIRSCVVKLKLRFLFICIIIIIEYYILLYYLFIVIICTLYCC